MSKEVLPCVQQDQMKNQCRIPGSTGTTARLRHLTFNLDESMPIPYPTSDHQLNGIKCQVDAPTTTTRRNVQKVGRLAKQAARRQRRI